MSRATFYREFGSRRELLEALEIEPDPDARARILAAAAELVGRDGLRALSMDELASRAGVSRASVYRLFPGKSALFDALVAEYSPFEQVLGTLERLGDRPPAEVLPEVARTVAMTMAPRMGIARSMFFEVSSQSPDALPGADPRIRSVLAAIGGYLARQMAAGHIRQMHPLLAAQLLMGPILFHLLTRAEIERLGIPVEPLDAAVDTLVGGTLRALATDAADMPPGG